MSRRAFIALTAIGLSFQSDRRWMSKREQNPTMDQETVQQLLERLGQAISAGDFKGVSACWEVPALFLSDEGAMAFANLSEIEKVMAQASESYRAQGIASTRPEIEGVERLSEKLAAVDVRWPSLDASGKEKASERSHYIMQLSKDGQPRIRVALTRTR